MDSDTAAPRPTPTSSPRQARTAGLAAFVGTSIEWYDFFIYGTASAIVFGPLFFPSVSTTVGVLASFLTFWVGFLARPLGGIIFGHLGDRIGRKKTLVVTLLMMGAATALIGVLPTYNQAGFAAPILLTVLRALQGIAVGGEWGGAVLIAAEHAGEKRRVLFGAFAQQGSPAGAILASLSFIGAANVSGDAFLSWGWRLPFLASAVLVIVGLVIRLSVEESPEFTRAREAARQKAESAALPVLDVVRRHPVALLLGIGSSAIGVAAAYFFNVFSLAHATAVGGVDRSTMLDILLGVAVVQFAAQPIGAALGQKLGATRVMGASLALLILMTPVTYLLLDTGKPWLVFVGLAVGMAPVAGYYALVAGFLANAFPVEVRYTGISLSYQLCATVLGGTAPLVATWLDAYLGGISAVAGYQILLALLTLMSVLALSRHGVRSRKTATSHARDSTELAG